MVLIGWYAICSVLGQESLGGFLQARHPYALSTARRSDDNVKYFARCAFHIEIILSLTLILTYWGLKFELSLTVSIVIDAYSHHVKWSSRYLNLLWPHCRCFNEPSSFITRAIYLVREVRVLFNPSSIVFCGSLDLVDAFLLVKLLKIFYLIQLASACIMMNGLVI